MNTPIRLLSSEEAGALDRKAMGKGRSGRQLMAAAARSITRAITARYRPCRTAVLCGPGNNGGDGLLVAFRLQRLGWPVQVVAEPGWLRRKGDAAWAQGVFARPSCNLSDVNLEQIELLVDAAFGAGLNKELEPDLADFFRAVSRTARIPIVAVDVPSGINGSSGGADPEAPRAELTVTFQYPKLGHMLLPGRANIGDLVVADIGIPETCVDEMPIAPHLNAPALWRRSFPERGASTNKYDSGHTIVLGGPEGRIGAALMTARAADAIGSGLVTTVCRPSDVPAYQARLLEVMIKPASNNDDLEGILSDRRVTAVAVGPAFGLDRHQSDWLECVLRSRKPTVVDADAITLIAKQPERFLPLLHENVVLTPHDGEFSRLFKNSGSRWKRAVEAAKASGCCIVLKGGDTTIASANGLSAITAHAPPALAKAGSGDVLSGLAVGLLAQAMPVFDAACAAVWLHGQAARYDGVMTASNLFSKERLGYALSVAAQPICE